MSDYECPRCKTEYNADGCHEDVAGEHECEECGFLFEVAIEYEPSYDVSCVVHEFGKPKQVRDLMASFCVHCGACNPDSVIPSR